MEPMDRAPHPLADVNRTFYEASIALQTAWTSCHPADREHIEAMTALLKNASDRLGILIRQMRDRGDEKEGSN